MISSTVLIAIDLSVCEAMIHLGQFLLVEQLVVAVLQTTEFCLGCWRF
jgi:hypothetical protein